MEKYVYIECMEVDKRYVHVHVHEGHNSMYVHVHVCELHVFTDSSLRTYYLVGSNSTRGSSDFSVYENI